jgi:2-oxoglutarate ferredoxin oxidoreductase subunit gamma
MNHEMLFAGFGGQGVILMGQIITYAGLYEDNQVSWIPSYGPEMRGGTANCSVIISDEPVGSPIVIDPGLVVAMNLPSLDKFEPALVPGGVLLINSSLIDRDAKRSDITSYKIPCNEIAMELGNIKVANMVMLGAVLAASKAVKPETVMEILAKKIFKNKPKALPLNQKAIQRGMECVTSK